MFYLQVLPADPGYHGHEPLTYSSEAYADVGTIVTVPLRNKKVYGIVVGSTSKPNFALKPAAPHATEAPLPRQLIELIDWMKAYYPTPLGVLAQLMLPKKLADRSYHVSTKLKPNQVHLPELTVEQQAALKNIKGTGMHLLHGETGSGKTRVYIELTRRAIENNKSAIVLTPEISLTSQLIHNFSGVFGDQVVMMHSQLSETTKRKTWQQILNTKIPLVVIGARSALFSPIANVGLIVIDEAHEAAYKQDQAPHYHASNVAAKLASLHGATLVLGSATPLVSDYYFATAKNRPVVRMLETALKTKADERTIKVIDLKERGKFARSPHLSDELIQRIERAIHKKEQSLLFLNRRGTARVVFCNQCGWQASCPHCDLPLVYHGDTHLMRCHSCAFQTSSPMSCPECRNTEIIFKAVGTKAIVDEIRRLFPNARTMRFDTDNKKSERVENNYSELHSGEVDILVGTQMLAKGLDLPKLGVVGIIMADSSLSFPDFTAKERTYQLLAQVMGRVGRGHRKGSVVVQTYNPKSDLLQSAKMHDWTSFYRKELEERRLFTFPPYCYLLKLTCKRASSAEAESVARSLVRALRDEHNKLVIEGPTPSFHQKTQNKFAWQVVVKATRRSLLTKIIANLPSGWSYDIDPTNLL